MLIILFLRSVSQSNFFFCFSSFQASPAAVSQRKGDLLTALSCRSASANLAAMDSYRKRFRPSRELGRGTERETGAAAFSHMAYRQNFPGAALAVVRSL